MFSIVKESSAKSLNLEISNDPCFDFIEPSKDETERSIFSLLNIDNEYFESEKYKEWLLKKNDRLREIEEQQEAAQIEEEKKITNNIIEMIDENDNLENQNCLHAGLSSNKYWNAGLNLVHLFTHDDNDRIWIGNSSNDHRSHYIIKHKKKNMMYEVHCAYGKWDIFPLTSINEYLEAYKPELLQNEQWIKLNENLPYYDMVPLDIVDEK